MVIESEGGIHVVWVDAFDSPKYVESTDGKVWTSPKKANFPFSARTMLDLLSSRTQMERFTFFGGI